MGLFNNLMSKIFGHASSAATAPAGQPSATTTAPASAPAAGTPAAAPVDVEAILNDMAKNNSEKLDWKHSIVDLMKLVGMDSSFGARKQLAQELGYTGDMGDSASMNVWLQKQVLKKLAENGGKVPAALLK